MDFPLPPMGEGLFEVELIRWLVKPGDAVKRGQPLIEVMSDKATMEVPAPFAGTITGTLAEPGTKVKVGQVVLSYDDDGTGGGRRHPGESPAESRPADADGAPAPAPVAVLDAHGNGHSARLPAAAPSVRHLARKLGVDLAKVRGTGPAGRVLLDDLAPFLAPPRPPRRSRPAPNPSSSTSAPPGPR